MDEDAKALLEKATQPQRGKGAAWAKAAKLAAERLGDDWIVTGTGIHATLIHTPIRWWYNEIGFDAASTDGYLTVAHQPLTVPVRPGIYGGYGGIRQNHYAARFSVLNQGKKIDAPSKIAVFELDAAVDTLVWWAQGPAMEVFDFWPNAKWAAVEEDEFGGERRVTAPEWPMLAGWRVILGTGSPLDVIDAVITELIEGKGRYQEDRGFWERFRELAVIADRVEMLRFLDSERRRSLIESCKVPDAAIADGLTGLF